MRKTALTVLAALALLASAGCPPPKPLEGPPAHAASRRGLTVELVLPKYTFYRGESVPLKVLARNTSEQPIVIHADSRALAHVKLFRRATDAWEEIKRYPDSAIMVARSWTLGPGRSRSFPLNIDVAPDWPTGEALRLAGGLNGRPDVAPAAMISVYPTRDAYEQATGLKAE